MKKQGRLLVRISGGLGNQIFKLLAGVRLSESLGKELVADTSWFEYFQDRNGRVHSRKFELNYFPKLNRLLCYTSSNPLLNRKMYQVARRLPTEILTKMGFVNEENFVSCENNLRARIMDGRFEDIQFLPRIDRIKDLFVFPDKKSTWLQSKTKEFGNQFIVLHVRTGDYLSLPEIYGFLTTDYYVKAIAEIKERLGDVPVVLFSENTDMAMKLLKGKVTVDHVLGSDKHVSSGETLELMSTGEGVISANSTFSWWAAMLGQIHETTKVVTIPSRYLASEEGEALRLRPAGWLVIRT